MPIDASNQASYVQNLLYGWSWTGNSGQGATITYTFESDQATLNDLRGSSAASNEADISGTSLQQAFLSAAAIWSSYANISFSPNDTPSAHHLVFGYAELPASQTDPDGNPITPAAIPYFNLQPLAGQGSTYFAAGEMNAGELLVSKTYTSFAVGSQAYYEVMHEMGHMLGLAHPFATNQFDHATYVNGHTTTDLAGYPYDTWDNSIMSYNLASQGSAVHSSSINRPVTPMIYDIAAIQFLYGAKTTTNSGSTGYDLTNLGVTDHVSTLWDAGGDDTISAGSTQNAAIIDLREGFHPNGTQYYSKVDNTVLFNAFGANIENAVGGAQSDEIFGNGSYEAGHYAHLSTLDFHGENHLQGLGGNDTIYGFSGDDILDGGADDDYLIGGTGADAMYGGAGFDWLNYEGATSSIKLLVTGWDTGEGGFSGYGVISGQGEAEGDTFSGIEGIIGTAFNDEIDLTGIGIVNGELPNILIDLGGGEDGISFANAQTDVSMTFTALAHVEYVTGSAQGDTLNAQALNSSLTFKGEGGADMLTGGSGDDSLYGGSGNDVLIGNAGTDLYRIFEGEGQDTIIDSDRNGDIRYGVSNFFMGNAIHVSGNTWSYGGEGLTYYLTLSGNDLIISDPAYSGSHIRIQGFVAPGTEAWANHFGGLRLQRPTDFGNASDDAINVNYSSYFTGEGEDGTLTGSAGNDLMDAAGGADTFDGSFGNDTITFANGNGGVITRDLSSSIFISIENLVGSAGSESLTGNSEANILWGAGGNDGLTGMFGNDTLYGGSGNDNLTGGNGDDVLNGGTGNDTVSYAGHFQAVTVDLGDGTASGAGSDTLISIEQVTGTSYADNITGGLDNDSLSGGSGNDTLNGGFGNDTLIGASGNDFMEGGDGNDSLMGGDGANTLSGGEGDDILIVVTFKQSTTSNNTVIGGTGNDGVHGGNRHDVLDGGSGNDNLHGNEGNDTLYGGTGNDLLWGDPTGEISTMGNDVLYGEDGNDSLNGSSGADTLDGGTGDDYLKGNGSEELIDTVANLLIGGSGKDTLEAGQAGDTLDGGLGDDQLISRNGADTFVIGQDSGASDTIQSFSISSDVINLSAFEDITSMGKLSLGSNPNGNSAVITLGGGQSVTLAGINHTSLTASNFIFAEGPNTPPIAVEDSYTLEEGATLSITELNGVLANDTDDDNDDLSAILVSDVAFGTLTLNADGSFSYTHDGSENHTDSFSYKVNDATDDGNTVTVSFTITPVTVTGTPVDDSLTGGSQSEILDGLAGNDTLFGGNGNDTLIGALDADVLKGEGGADVYRIADKSHSTAASMDMIVGFSQGSDKIDLSALGFSDIHNGQSNAEGTALAYWFQFGDTFIGNADGSFRLRIDGELTLTRSDFIGVGPDYALTHTGTGGNDSLIGGTGNDAFDGGKGQDVMRGKGGSDIYFFDHLEDSKDSSPDTILEWDNGDVIDVSYLGFTGIQAGSANGSMLGWAVSGSYTEIFDSGKFLIRIHNATAIETPAIMANNFIFSNGLGFTDETYSGTSGADTYTTGLGNDVLNGNDGDDVLTGGGGHDTLDGGNGNDTLYGGDGDDTLFGQGGYDRLEAGAGHDRLIAGVNKDWLVGGSGNDTFSFFSDSHSSDVQPDTIADFVQGQDVIDISTLTYTSIQAGSASGTVLGFTHQQNSSSQNITVIEADTGMFEIIVMGHVNLASGDFAF